MSLAAISQEGPLPPSARKDSKTSNGYKIQHFPFFISNVSLLAN